jgi:ubiquinone/menaquinone biosynthesis C-methylase UbiE
VVGIDISPEVLQMAKRHYPRMDSMKADIRSLPFGDGHFDSAVSLSTLDHFDTQSDILTALDELRRVLRPAGRLVLTMDNLRNPAIWVRNALPFRWLNTIGLVPYYVGQTCSPRRLCRYLQQTGFEVLQSQAIVHCPRALAVAAARCLQGRAGGPTQARFLYLLQSFERLGNLPTRFFTGYFVAVNAVKRGRTG